MNRSIFGRVRPEYVVDALVSQGIDPSDSIVITGFWRSGTTWLLQSLCRSIGAKSVFEPFDPKIEAYRSALPRRSDYPIVDGVLPDTFMPHVSDECPGDLQFRRYIRRVLTASVPGTWLRKSRRRSREHDGRISSWKLGRLVQRLRDATRTRVVCKLVRGQLMIPALVRWFNPTIIHLQRDPRSVVASVRRSLSSVWNALSLEKQLLGIKDGREKYFQEWVDVIKRFDKKSNVARFAAYWALTEKYVSKNENKVDTVLSYEKVCSGRGEYLSDKVEDFINVSEWKLGGESITTFESERKMEGRLYGWEEELETDTIRQIEETVCEIGMRNRLSALSSLS